jgi:YVTN family beta-propeller protein
MVVFWGALVPVTTASGASWTAVAPSAYSPDALVTPIDLGTNTAGAAVSTPGATAQLGVAISPDGRTAYSVSAGPPGGSHALVAVDLTTSPPSAGTPVDLTGTPAPPSPRNTQNIAISPDGRKAYVSDSANNQVIPIDLTTTPVTVGAGITVGSDPEGIAFSPDGATAYVADYGPGTIIPIRVSTDTAMTPIPVGTHPRELAITPDGKTAYVADNGSSNVYPVTLPSGPVGKPISVGAGLTPLGIAITPDGTKAYTANFGTPSVNSGSGSTVTPITLSTGIAGTPITVGGGPWSIAVTPDSKTVYVGNSNDGSVTPIDVATGTAGPPIAGVRAPRSIAITPDQAPVANFAVTSAPPGSTTTFDASASTVRFGTIVKYVWSFGDGTAPVTTTAPVTGHVYSTVGTYAATVTETDSAGTSTTGEVFTGQTASSVASAGAETTRAVVITAPNLGAPAVRVSSSGLDFGTLALGSTSPPRTLTVTNTGTAPLIISSSALRGANPANFTVTTDSCTGHTIAAGAACSVVITFRSATVGGRSATIAFTDNASGSPHTVSLTGAATHLVTLSGHVTLNGGGVAGAAVQACPTASGLQTNCVSTQTSSRGAYAVTIVAPPGAVFSLTAFPPNGVRAGPGTLSPITVPSADFAGLDIALPAPPSIPSGATFVSPSFGTETAGTANPVLFWNEPSQIQVSRSLFPGNGTVVVTQIVVHGTNALTGAPASRVVNVGGTVAGNPVGQTVGGSPVRITLPPLYPIHGQISTQVRYRIYAAGPFAPTGIAAPQVLYEVYPPPNPQNALAPQPTDPLPAYFTNVGYAGRVLLGGGSITGADAPYFKVVPLTSYGVPAGTTDCGFNAATLAQFDQTTSTPPPSTSCGIAVLFTPPPLPPATRIFYRATLEVPVSAGGLPGTMKVGLIGCDEDVATQASFVTGIDACGASNPPEGDDPDPEPDPPDPPPVIIPGPYIDPSGTVYARTSHGPLIPLSGATVRLQTSKHRRGPFRQLRNRSIVMSPANRRNPDHTSVLGGFGWDVLPGYYRVAATHPGCQAPAGNGMNALTRVLAVPPPALHLTVVLRCPRLRRAMTHTTLRAQRESRRRVVLVAHVRGRHPHGVVKFLTGARALGSAPVDTRSGRATLSITGRSTRGFTARYEGDALNGPSSAGG